MTQDMGFSIASVVILLVISYRNYYSKHVPSVRSVTFSFLILCGVVDIALDILCSTCIAYSQYLPGWLTLSTTWIFYFVQMTLAYFMFLFDFAMLEDIKKYTKYLCFLSIPYLAALAAWLINPFTGILFYLDEAKVYQRPLTNSIIYIEAAFYLIGAAVAAYILRSRIGRKCTRVILHYSAVMIVTVLIQFFIPQTAITGLGIAYGITLMYLYLQNADSVLDTLTLVFDREALNQYLNGGLVARETYGIVMSLSGFQSVNLVYGSNVGDEILRQTGRYFRKLCEQNKKCEAYRLMGDIFLIICRDRLAYQNVREGIRSRCERSYWVEDKRIHLNAHIIYMEGIDFSEKYDEIVPIIEYAISKAKSNPLGGELTLDREIIDEFYYLKDIEKYLYEAVDKKLFSVNYQPIWSVQNRKFEMLESLVRLNHPKYGKISPDVFVPIAERDGLIPKITMCVLELVTDFICRNDPASMGIKNIKVNLSAVDLMDSGLKSRIERTIDRAGLKREYIGFEITETAATNFNKEVRDLLAWMKEKGISLSMDDFGTGYANLKMVMELSFDTVKLDRSMLTAAMENPKNRNIYHSISNMFNELGLGIVAEGAETREEVQMLEMWNVSYIQGYYYSKPLDEQELLELLKTNGKH